MIPNEDQVAIRDLARRFARERLAPHYQAREASGILDRSLLREMGGLGLPLASPRASSPKNSPMATSTSAPFPSAFPCLARSS
jgi:alkylation response protein AidB-like acyl-CoA dehydrogenase